MVWGCGLDLTGSGHRVGVGFFFSIAVDSCSVKDKEYFEQLSNCYLFKYFLFLLVTVFCICRIVGHIFCTKTTKSQYVIVVVLLALCNVQQLSPH